VRRIVGGIALAALGLLALVTVGALALGWSAFGQRSSGARRARMERSPQWKGGAFENPQPLRNQVWGSIAAMFKVSPVVQPAAGSVPVDQPSLGTPSLLRVTWLGHSTTLVELDGHRVLTDPVFSDRPTPVAGFGPKRWYPPPIALDKLPPVDVVVISHDHYDHLDAPTLLQMKAWDTTFVVPLGVAAHLVYWGIPESRIVELDWWEGTDVRGLRIVCVPARHASGRALFDKDMTLWAGWALMGAEHRVYYSGDTGLFPAMKEIGARLGPFDLAMVEVGQYNPAWPDWHIGPEQAVKAVQWVRGKVFLPVHWGLFVLAAHGWTEPIERAVVEAERLHQPILTPRPGQSVEPLAGPAKVQRWWPDLPWNRASEDPIVSTQVE
jgi:L-ascorbate metabolism protein UlaG (beta-lactamase superfamily)